MASSSVTGTATSGNSSRLGLTLLVAGLLGSPAAGQTPARMNAVIDLLERGQPVFGLYLPRQPEEALRYQRADFFFDGSMEHDYERALPNFLEYARGLANGGAFPAPLIVKTPAIAPDPRRAAERIARQLEFGASGIVLVGVESPEEVRAGLAAMRFRSRGGTRPDEVGAAPAYWGMNAAEYRERADLWPLNPTGQLINWTIVESKAGLARVREIAAVEGLGVLFPGAGTLRRVFTSTDASGNRVFDRNGWEAAIQQVLSACKEFTVPCGYPANADDIELRMRQGFRVFVIGWGEQGFKTIDIGREAARR